MSARGARLPLKRPAPAAAASRFAKLTARETQLVAAMVGGCFTNQSQAEELGVSVETIKRHLATIREKAGVDNSLQLAVLWLEEDFERRLAAAEKRFAEHYILVAKERHAAELKRAEIKLLRDRLAELNAGAESKDSRSR